MKPKIVVLEGYPVNPGDNPWSALEEIGELVVHDRTSADLVVERAREADVLLVNKVAVPGTALVQLPRLRLIVVMATGVDPVDIAKARELSVPVSNVPVYATDSVAEHTFALILELARRIGLHDRAVHEGGWTACPDFSYACSPLVELAGLTMGLVGLGRIGHRVGELASAFRMRVIAHDPTRCASPRWPGFRWVEVEELFGAADVVSLHCPLTQATRGLVGESLLSRMKRGAFLVNTARGGLVNEAELARALDVGPIAGAAVDVVSVEPARPDNPLLTARNCIITPHNAWASLAARRRLMETVVSNVRALVTGQPVNVVNGIEQFRALAPREG